MIFCTYEIGEPSFVPAQDCPFPFSIYPVQRLCTQPASPNRHTRSCIYQHSRSHRNALSHCYAYG